MAISNCLFSPTSENPRGFSVCCVLAELSAITHATTHSRDRYLQAENPIAQSSTFHFFVPQKIKRACLFPTLTQNKNQN